MTTRRNPDAVFAALGDPTRRSVLQSIASAGNATATELAAQLPVSRQAVVKHLGRLGSAGLVTAQRQGREVRYQLSAEPLTEAVAWIAELGAVWDKRLARLEDLF